MKILISFLLVLSFTSCNKEKDFKVVKKIQVLHLNGSLSDTIFKTEKLKAYNTKGAFEQIMFDSIYSSELNKLTRKNYPKIFNDSILEIKAFDLKNNEISKNLSEHIKDSILKLVTKKVQKSMVKIEKDFNKPIKHTKEEVEKLLSDWNGSLPSLVEYTKQHLNNPDSFKHVETGYIRRPNYILIRMKYRAQNGFGAIITSSISAKVDYSGNIIKVLE